MDNAAIVPEAPDLDPTYAGKSGLDASPLARTDTRRQFLKASPAMEEEVDRVGVDPLAHPESLPGLSFCAR